MHGHRQPEERVTFEEVRYIMFDLNGTLVTENYLRYDEVLEKVLKCQRKGRALTAEDMREVAKGQRPLSALIAELYTTDDPETVSQRFFRVEASRIVFRENAVEVLDALHARYRLILCSDTTGIAKEVVKNLELSKYFTKIFYSCDIGYLKSEEAFWINMLHQFPDAEPWEFLVIGDNLHADIQHPSRLGMHTVRIANPIRLSFDYRETSDMNVIPEYSIRELEELLPLLGLKQPG